MITNEQLQLFEQRLDANPANAIAMNAVVHNGVVKSAISYEAFRQQRHEFSVNIKTGGDHQSKGKRAMLDVCSAECHAF